MSIDTTPSTSNSAPPSAGLNPSLVPPINPTTAQPQTLPPSAPPQSDVPTQSNLPPSTTPNAPITTAPVDASSPSQTAPEFTTPPSNCVTPPQASPPQGDASPTTNPSTPAPASSLKQSSYASTPHNPIPNIPSPDTSPIELGECPLNTTKEPVVCTLTVPPVADQHPCTFLYEGFKDFCRTASRCDTSMVICPLYNKDGKIPNIPVGVPQAFPESFEHMPAYLDVDENQLKLAFGTDNQGRKRKQGNVFCTFIINSDIDPRFLIRKLAPLMDVKRMNLQVKKLQKIRTKCHWALGAMSSEVDAKGLVEMVRFAFQEELKSARMGSKLFEIDEVPDFVITMRALRLVYVDKKKKNDVTDLEFYAARLRRAGHIECSEHDVASMDLLLSACEVSGILRKYVGRKIHALFFQRDGDKTFDKMSFRIKVEGHMSYQAMTATMDAPDIQDLHRRVQVVMAPLEDGSIPECPWKYTSLLRELTSFLSSDDKPLIDALVPVLSGPRAGATTVVFKQCEEAESFVTAFVQEPCAFLYYVLTVEKGYREDCALSICKSFDIAARGRISASTWNSEDWTISTPYTSISDTFASDLYEEGYRLSEHDKVSQPAPNVSAIIANQDLANVTRELGLKSDDVTLATQAPGGVSVISGISNGTLGNTSLRSTDTQQFHRGLEDQCIANAKAMEAAAAARWSTPSAQPSTTPAQGSNVSPAVFNSTHTPSSAQLPSSAAAHASSSALPVSSPTPAPSTGTAASGGEPASEKQSGLGTVPPKSDTTGGAGGPQGPR